MSKLRIFISFLIFQYQEIFLLNPDGIKIAEWLDVDNSKGLVHWSFQLTDEHEEGFYYIAVKSQGVGIIGKYFRVKEYVKPRFQVDVKPPNSILITQHSFTFTACAKYPFGEPVKGNIHWEITNNRWSSCKAVIKMNSTISGCSDITVKSSDLRIAECDINRIKAEATITDAASDEVEKGTSEIGVQTNNVRFETLYQDDFMKPNLPFTLKVLAKLPDESPASGEPLEICHGHICNNITTPSDGIVKLYLTNPNSQRVVMKHMVSRAFLNGRLFELIAQRYYSPSNSSLVIHVPEETINCSNGEETRFTFKVLFAAVQQRSAVVNVQVMSRGKMQYFKSEEYQLTSSKFPFEEEFFMDHLPLAPADTVTGVLNIPVTLPLTAAPKIQVLVWYIRGDGEVVSDVRNITVEKCLPNKVDFAWFTNRAQPGLANSFTITTTPGSICSYGVQGTGLDLETIRRDTETIDSFFLRDYSYNEYMWSSTQVDDREYCKRLKAENPKEYNFSYLPDDTISEFSTDYIDTLHMFEQSGLYIFTDLTLETRPCYKQDYRRYSDPRNGRAYSSYSSSQKNFHETLLWNLAVVPSTGILKQDVEVPPTFTEWIGTAVCVHPHVGVGVSKSSSLTTNTSFSVDILHPPSIKRGEDMPVKIFVFNNLQQPLPVRVTLEGSTEYELIGENNAGLPAGQRLFCVGAQDRHVHTIKIRPITIGQVNITVRASVDTETSVPCGDESLNIGKMHELVSPLQVRRRYLREETWRKYICAKGRGQDSLETTELTIPPGMVEGSGRAWISVVGEQLVIPLEDLQTIILDSQKCYDDNIMELYRHLFIFKYLQTTKQGTYAVEEKLLDVMRRGYRCQMLYQRLDGSFSIFGNANDSSSTSLTALVLRIFSQAKEFIPIDDGSLNAATSWLINNYGNETCAQSIEDGQTTEDPNHEESSRVSRTADILRALLESGVSASHPTVLQGVRCLNQSDSLDYYTMALKAYTLALAGIPEARAVLDQLMEEANITDTLIHWFERKSDSGNNKFYKYDEETRAIVILAMVAIDPSTYQQELRKLVRSLPPRSYHFHMPNEKKSFTGEALSAYESSQYQDNQNVDVAVTTRDFQHTFFMTKNNKLFQPKVSLPILPTNVSFSMKGQGCALIQTILHYNAPDPDDTESRGL
ncbi:alpha-1-inhibitor 3-like [Palaemon carinicauda]|uniref:alpha-1-inhibitor 3-like n=1 Tax=Palaemon carinicauda TaxID=392227 RepID=UPI0035B5ED51